MLVQILFLLATTPDLISASPEPTLTPYLNNPCLDTTKVFKDQPWCDSSLGYNKRIADMLSRMTLTEKISALDTVTPTIDSLGINAYNWWSEATHGISHNRNSDKTPYESNFAFPITTAMAYNRSLWHATGFQIGLEGRAFMNNGDAWSTFWAPVINLAREPRWGRNIETPGEDPYLSGEYATEFVQGFQNHPDDPKHLMASACCKHYVANSMEDTKQQNIEWTRHDYDANITQQDLVDSYMPAFQACVEKGKVSSLMCSYNSVNGVPSCANDWLLKDIARDAWHFDGYITSDCDADEDVFSSHHYTKTPEETVADVLHAGTDVDCTSFVGAHAMSALNQSLITEEDIDERLAMLWRVRLRLSHFDPLGPLNAIPPSAVCSASAIELARDGARQGSTLLKNEGAVLPLNANKLSTVAVIGPNSNMSEAVAHYYGGNTCGNHYYNMIDAVATYMTASGTVSSLGVPTVNSNDTSGVAASAKQAAAADQTVLVLGTDLTDAREGSDATTLAFSEGQLALIEAVAAACAAAKKPPLVVVTITAVPLDISALLSDARIGAILHVGQPSVQTLGIGDVLFGATSPAGRTVQTIYPAAYVDGISIFDFNMRPGTSIFSRPDCTKANASDCPRGTNPGRTHRFYTGTTVVPFGYGLSYTTFKYSVSATKTDSTKSFSLQSLRTLLEDSDNVVGDKKFYSLAKIDAATLNSDVPKYKVTVTNTGTMDSDDVVLGFIAPPGAGQNGVPLQSLFGFERVHVKAGDSVDVYLYPSLMEFAKTELNGTKTVLDGEYKIWFGVKDTLKLGGGYVETVIRATN